MREGNHSIGSQDCLTAHWLQYHPRWMPHHLTSGLFMTHGIPAAPQILKSCQGKITGGLRPQSCLPGIPQ